MTADVSAQSISFGKRIDFHTHILPKMDDGSSSDTMSLQMLQTSSAQGAAAVVLTPHFYPTRDDPAHFLQKRDARLAHLASVYDAKSPQIIAGAEVHYFEGLTCMTALPQMRIGRTASLMVEMPMCTWTDRMLRDIAELGRSREYQVILAHIERYLPYGNLPAVRQLAAGGVKMQLSADAFSGFWQARRMLRLWDEGLVHVLGSDCHNLTSRPPNLAAAYEYIERKRGERAVLGIIQNGLRLLTPIE